MPHAQLEQSKATRSIQGGIHAPAFLGFKAPTSNTTYTPNQFFDVVIPHFSRGVVRILAYLIRKTLGWCDAQGNPQEEQIRVSYSELEIRAGVSRDMIRQALDDALAGRLIECVREGRPKLAHDAGQSALYQLRWDSSAGYKGQPADFQGFFEGEGNRTDIPNEFFDVVIPHEPLSVIKVVGSVIRHSIGFQAKHGRRRQQVALSYQHIANYARFGSSSDLAKALRIALERNYIVRVEEGVFSPFRSRRHSATYSLRWCDSLIGQKIAAAENQSEIRTSIGQISEVADRSENRSSIKTKPKKETLKQPVVGTGPVFERLRAEGFSGGVAVTLAEGRTLEEVENQVAWLRDRAPFRSRLGLLRRAIEGNWPAPERLRTSEVLHPQGREFARHFYAAFGGNHGEPVNQPSLREAETAEHFVKRLLAVREDASLIPEWGKSLGKTAREQRHPFPSLTLAVRQFGDAFLAATEKGFQVKQRDALDRDQAQHQEHFLPDYLAFLKAQEDELKVSARDDFARFEAKRHRERAEIAARRVPWHNQAFLAHFDSEPARLGALQGFFGLPDFWQWDREFNQRRFNPDSQ